MAQLYKLDTCGLVKDMLQNVYTVCCLCLSVNMLLYSLHNPKQEVCTMWLQRETIYLAAGRNCDLQCFRAQLDGVKNNNTLTCCARLSIFTWMEGLQQEEEEEE